MENHHSMKIDAIVRRTAAMYSKPINADAIADWVSILGNYDEFSVARAFREWVKVEGRMPTPANILQSVRGKSEIKKIDCDDCHGSTWVEAYRKPPSTKPEETNHEYMVPYMKRCPKCVQTHGLKG